MVDFFLLLSAVHFLPYLSIYHTSVRGGGPCLPPWRHEETMERPDIEAMLVQTWNVVEGFVLSVHKTKAFGLPAGWGD